MISNSPALAQLQLFFDQWSTSQKLLFLVINGSVLLIVDYIRMLQLRRKMVRADDTPLVVPRTILKPLTAAWAISTSNHWEYTSPPRHQTMGVLRAGCKRVQFPSHHILDWSKSNCVAQRRLVSF